MAVLGAILVDHELFDVVSEHITAADFYAHVHETIFAAITDLAERQGPIDKIALAEELAKRKNLEDVGGIAYLTSLMDTVQTAGSAEWYAKIIAEKAGLRRIIAIGTEATNRGYQDEEIGPVAVANLITEKLENSVVSRTPQKALSGPALASELERDWLDPRARRLHTPWGAINSGPKGFGLREQTVWAGYPAQGKSTAVLNLADFTARRYGREIGAVGFWPGEMGRIKTNYKALSMYTGLDSKAIEERDLTADEMARCRGALRMLADLPLVMFETGMALDVPTLRLQLRKLKRERGLSAFFIDHIGWFREVREAEAKAGASGVHSAQNGVFQAIKEMAEEFECAMHTVMHLKRPPADSVKDGKYPKPSMFDLRGGGNPEGHAHTIMLVWRPDPKEDPRNGAFIVEKARSGGESTHFLEYRGEESLWLDQYDTSGYMGRWFEPAVALRDTPPVALPYSNDEAPVEEDEGFESWPDEEPEWLGDDDGSATSD